MRDMRFPTITAVMRLLLLTLVLGAGFLFATPLRAQAAYDPNNLIRDDLFIDSNSMNEAGIQAFLEAHGSCLATVDPALLDSTSRASTLIYNAAQQFGISPKVILTTMQKEWGVLTKSCAQLDNLYGSFQGGPQIYLKRVLGYNVPDVLGIGDCLYSFRTQLFGNYCAYGNAGAGNYLGSPASMRNNWNLGRGPVINGSTVFYPNPFTIQEYSDRQGNITITPQTKATSVLYRYTPYAYYGNYNFWNLYNNVFFPPAAYSASYEGQVTPGTFSPGDTVTGTLKIKNKGYVTWLNNGTNPLHLETSAPIGRSSVFADSTWYAIHSAGNRAAVLGSTEAGDSIETVEAGKVKPGQVAVFNISFTAPSNLAPGSYREFFTPILEGLSGTIEMEGVYFDLTVQSHFNAQWNNQSAFPTVVSGSTTTAWIKYKNTGRDTWVNSGPSAVTLATARPYNGWSMFVSDDWPGGTSGPGNRPSAAGTGGSFTTVEAGDSGASITPGQVKPGQIGTFPYTFKAHDWIPPGSYNQYFTLTQDGGVGQFGPDDVYSRISIVSRWSAAWYGQSSFISIGSGQTGTVTIKFINSGTSTWSNSGPTPVQLATARPFSSWSMFVTDDWVGGVNGPANRPGTFSSTEAGTSQDTITPGQVKPNQVGVFTFTMKAHDWISLGSYNQYFTLTQDGGVGQFGPDDVYERITINPPWSSAWYSQSPFVNTTHGQFATLTFRYTNTGSTTWLNTGANPVILATARPFNRGSIFVTDTWINASRAATFSSTEQGYSAASITAGQVKPGQIAVFTFTIKTHDWIPLGSYNEYFVLTQDNSGGHGPFGPDDVYERITIH